MQNTCANRLHQLAQGLVNWPKTRVSELLGIQYPIVLAPMHQSVTKEIIGTPQLVAAVSNAGGLGIFGSGTLCPTELRRYIREIKSLTDKPFGVNLLVPYKHRKQYKDDLPQKIEFSKSRLKQIAQEAGLDDPSQRERKRLKRDYDTEMFPHFGTTLDICIEECVPVVQFAFGVPPFNAILRCQRNGITTMGTCTSLREALELQKSGVNMLVVQGCEAGGQRAVFLDKNLDETDRQGTFVLVPQLSRAITSIPIIACGGIMDGRGIVACLALGSEGVMMGTAFIRSNETYVSNAYRKVLDENAETLITRSFTGRPVRAIANRYVRVLEKQKHMIPEFPIQHNITTDLMRSAVKQGKLSMIPIFVGQGYKMCQDAPASQIFQTIITEVRQMIHPSH